MPLHARKRLPDTRKSITTKIELSSSQDIYLTTGFYDEDYEDSIIPAEVFCKIGKHGDVVSGLLEGLCIALSVAFQHGVDWATVRKKYVDMKFGADYGHYNSILHAFVIAMDKNIEARKQQLGPQIKDKEPCSPNTSTK